MTDEKKEVYEIKKESVKQFLVIVGGSFLGCILAIILMGQTIQPKCHHHCSTCHLIPPAHAKLHHCNHHHKGNFDKIHAKKAIQKFKSNENQLKIEVKKEVGNNK